MYSELSRESRWESAHYKNSSHCPVTMSTVDGSDELWTIDVAVRDKVVKVSCGDATQRIKWLGHVGIARYDEKKFQGWKLLGVPTKISRADGSQLDMGAVIREVLRNGETIFVKHSLDPQEADPCQ